ncbi:MAG: SDR family oxidoreductase [Deltaproteobacteria bacterium]|nr:SDR family oxidoreductase [Deltaproteobacteria bacterium]
MKCLVTGAAGFIGSNLVEHLLSRGDDVMGVDNFMAGKRENIAPFEGKIRFVEGDVRDKDLCLELVRDVDWVFHLAALASVPWSVEEPALAHDHNINGTLNILLAAREAGAKKVVFASSAAIYGDDPELPAVETSPPAPASPYALHKLAGEQYIALFKQIYDSHAVCLRFFNVFGPRQDPNSMYAAAIPKLLERILKGERPTIFGNGEQTRDFIHVSDIVRGLLVAAQAPPEADGQVFNLGCGDCVSINDLVNKMFELLGSDIEPEYAPARPGDVMHSQANIDKARQVLGFEPKLNALTGLTQAIGWYRENL